MNINGPNPTHAVEPAVVENKVQRAAVAPAAPKDKVEQVQLDPRTTNVVVEMERNNTLVFKFIDEKTGKMKTLKTPAVILDGVVCKSLYSGQRIFCPRSIHHWWREVWLERVAESSVAKFETPACSWAGASHLERTQAYTRGTS